MYLVPDSGRGAWRTGSTTFINTAIADGPSKVARAPIVFEVPVRTAIATNMQQAPVSLSVYEEAGPCAAVSC